MSFFSKCCVVLFLLSICANTYANKKWEYLSKTIILQSDKYTTQQLNKLGLKNWELVDCAEAKGKLVCIFKRRV